MGFQSPEYWIYYVLQILTLREVKRFLGMNFRIAMRIGDFCKFIYTTVSVDPPPKQNMVAKFQGVCVEDQTAYPCIPRRAGYQVTKT